MASLALAALIGLALGSVPSAWLLARFLARRDVIRAGSGNVGALNALRVTRSRWIGVAVLLLDASKGALAVLLGGAATGDPLADPGLACAAALGAVAGHNYNPWLSFAHRRLVGGKGFATAGGAGVVAWPWLPGVWLGVCLAAWLGLRGARGITDEAPASALATLAILPAGLVLYGTSAAVFGAGLSLLVAPKLLPEALAVLRGPTEEAPPAA